ncbi:MAG: GH25 family lysozyme [Lachnospiraceae bacterium]
MKLSGDYEQPHRGDVLRLVMASVVFVAAIFILVLAVNKKDSPSQKPVNNTQTVKSEQQTVPDMSKVPDASALSPEDFDFWDMYGESEESTEEEIEETVESKPEDDPATDGRHTKLVGADGKEEWVLISPYLPKNEYDYTKLVCQSNLMKYYVEGRQVSFVGADISKYQDYVDFVKLKKAGVDFVMLRVGGRGYSTGQLNEDDYFEENLKRAKDAGLSIGLYFSSQAITEEEAEEEARFLLERIGDAKIDYPIAIDMGFVENDTARVEEISRAERTNLTKKFLETIEMEGYIPMIYGDKDWLLKRVDLSKLTDYDIWYSETADLPDYPYRFSMWQYTKTASIDGISGYANLNISFIDFTEK